MPKKVDKEAKKDKILKAAMKVFAKKGIFETKMEMVAQKAGIAKGTIYEYFKSKDELAQMVFNYLLVQMNMHVKQDMAIASSPAEKLKAGILAYVDVEALGLSDISEILPDLWAYGIRLRNSRADVPFDLRWIYLQYRDLFGRALQEGIDKGHFKNLDPKSVSAFIVAAADGFYLQWMSDRKNFNLKNAAEDFIDKMLAGIGNN
ncbi:MAG: TetR/AcrR family transcriptional regulator [Candidatus Zixiibacteriota bacterium]|nr:MAG: TetR/AcrR family transcriptional regulator [candidate division Zixibacteria bacterium]